MLLINTLTEILYSGAINSKSEIQITGDMCQCFLNVINIAQTSMKGPEKIFLGYSVIRVKY